MSTDPFLAKSLMFPSEKDFLMWWAGLPPPSVRADSYSWSVSAVPIENSSQFQLLLSLYDPFSTLALEELH